MHKAYQKFAAFKQSVVDKLLILRILEKRIMQLLSNMLVIAVKLYRLK